MTILITIMSNPISVHSESAFRDWIANVHVRQVVELPGVVSAQTFHTSRHSRTPRHPYLTLLELDTDDISTFQSEMNARAEAGQMVMSPSMDWDGFEGHYWVSLTPRLTSQRPE